jgi:hypothetical protein
LCRRELLEQLDALRINLALKAQKTVNNVTHRVLQILMPDADTSTRYAIVPQWPPLLQTLIALAVLDHQWTSYRDQHGRCPKHPV